MLAATGIALALVFVLDVESIPPWLAGVPAWLPLVLVPVGLLTIGWAYLKHTSTRYLITTEEIYRKTGLFDRDVAQIRLDRIQNTTVSQSFRQRLFSYGDITIYTAGSDTLNIILDDVPKPDRVNRVLTEGIDTMASASNE